MTIFEYIVCNAEGPQFNSWVGKIPCRRDRLPTPVFLGFPCGSAGKESACDAGDLGLIPSLGSSPVEKGMATHSSILAWRIPMDRGAYEATVHGVTKSRTQLCNFHFHFDTHKDTHTHIHKHICLSSFRRISGKCSKGLKSVFS